MSFKLQVHEHYMQLLDARIAMLQKVLADLKESGANETKSTAGDKHETALAMLQIEQANTREQLNVVVEQKAELTRLNASNRADVVARGSLVKTSKGYFYISTALGKASVESITVWAISAQSPLGIKLMGLNPGEETEINGNKYVVELIE